jgi:hypothetical protein
VEVRRLAIAGQKESKTMTYFLAVYSISITIVVVWVFMKNANLADENDYLTDRLRKSEIENKTYRDAEVFEGIAKKTGQFNSNYPFHADKKTGMDVTHEDG